MLTNPVFYIVAIPLLSAVIGVSLLVFRRKRRRNLATAERRFISGSDDPWMSLGWANARSFRIWYCVYGDTTATIEIRETSTNNVVISGDVTLKPGEMFPAGAITVPDCLDSEASLAPARLYHVRVSSGPTVWINTIVETSNEDASLRPERLSLGFFSCHQPFAEDGKQLEDAHRMMRAAHAAFTEFEVGRVLALGDQVYSDMPGSLSLFSEAYCRFAGISESGNILDAEPATLRDAFRRRYSAFWKFPEFRRILQDFPNAMMLDDHDIVDNWGTSARHSDQDFQRLKSAALDAWIAYQGSRFADYDPEREGTDFTFRHGPIASFVMDLRTEKRSDGHTVRIYSDRQLERLEAFMEDNAEAPVMLLGLTLPFLHVPHWFIKTAVNLSAEDSDFADRWSNPKARNDRDRLLLLIKRHQEKHPEQKIAILSGDIHMGMVMRFEWSDGTGPILQIASSAISNRQSDTAVLLANKVPGLDHSIHVGEHRLEGKMLDIDGINPWGGLNVGVIDIDHDGDEWKIIARIIAMNGEGGWKEASSFQL